MAQLLEAQDEYRQDQNFVNGYRSAEDLARDVRAREDYVRKKSIDEERRNYVKRLMSKNYDIPTIIDLTGLSEEQIKIYSV